MPSHQQMSLNSNEAVDLVPTSTVHSSSRARTRKSAIFAFVTYWFFFVTYGVFRRRTRLYAPSSPVYSRLLGGSGSVSASARPSRRLTTFHTPRWTLTADHLPAQPTPRSPAATSMMNIAEQSSRISPPRSVPSEYPGWNSPFTPNPQHSHLAGPQQGADCFTTHALQCAAICTPSPAVSSNSTGHWWQTRFYWTLPTIPTFVLDHWSTIGQNQLKSSNEGRFSRNPLNWFFTSSLWQKRCLANLLINLLSLQMEVSPQGTLVLR